MKDPVKLARKELPKYGARLVNEHRGAATFVLPNGGRWTVSPGVRLAHVRDVIDDCYLASVGLRGFTAVIGPEINPTSLRSSDHFLERLDLMHAQAGVTMREVLEVLARPRRVLAHHTVPKLAVIGPRVAPLITQEGADLVLTTLQWSTAELWARYPRPEKEGSHDDHGRNFGEREADLPAAR